MDQNDFVVVITGAAGNIGSILVFLIAKENIFGESHNLILRLIDLPEFTQRLNGLAMELEDCLFRRLKKVEVLPEIIESYAGADCVILVAGKPRVPGMERVELLQVNAQLFKKQASLCEGNVKANAKILVVANPCNTNALVFSRHCPSVPSSQITALSRLDHNRAINFVASYLKVPPQAIHDVTVFGNHSNTMLADISKGYLLSNDTEKATHNIKPKGKKTQSTKIRNVMPLRNCLPDDFIRQTLQDQIRQRGGSIIKAKGSSSGYSAANAIVEHLRNWFLGSNGEIVSMAVIVDGFRGIDEKLCISLPAVCTKGSFSQLENEEDGLTVFEKESMRNSVEELVCEKEAVNQFLGNDSPD
jgi:malate dehydrogenase